MPESARPKRPSLTLTTRGLVRVILLGFVIGGTLALGLGIFIVVGNAESDLRGAARVMIQSTNAREAEIIRVSNAVDQLSDPPCQAADLTALRRLVLSSGIVQDIARRSPAKLLCSALYGSQPPAIPALATPGYVISPAQTVWRNAALPLEPTHRFLIVAHHDAILTVRPANPTPYFREDQAVLSRFFYNRATGEVSWFRGPQLDVPHNALHGSAAFWTRGDFVSIACSPDQTICLALSAPWIAILAGNAAPFASFAVAGALLGSAASVMLMLWRQQRRSLYRGLRHAIRHDELVMAYQPIVDSRTGQIVAAEALMRWTRKGGAIITPDSFIPAAEESGLVGALTCLAIRDVGRDLGPFLRTHPDFRISINIVADDLADPRFHAALFEHLENHGISPSQIALELTERRAAQVEAAAASIDQLRVRGYRIYIDDFGTGYSSLTYLSDLSIDAIKLDKSFTSTVDTRAARARLVPPIMDMAREIGVPVIVEGVETISQATYFRAHGAMFMQGWLFGRAMKAEALVKWKKSKEGLLF